MYEYKGAVSLWVICELSWQGSATRWEDSGWESGRGCCSSTHTVAHPALANSSATVRPMPPPAPVMIACFPLRTLAGAAAVQSWRDSVARRRVARSVFIVFTVSKTNSVASRCFFSRRLSFSLCLPSTNTTSAQVPASVPSRVGRRCTSLPPSTPR